MHAVLADCWRGPLGGYVWGCVDAQMEYPFSHGN
jgi:hypothetical protein